MRPVLERREKPPPASPTRLTRLCRLCNTVGCGSVRSNDAGPMARPSGARDPSLTKGRYDDRKEETVLACADPSGLRGDCCGVHRIWRVPSLGPARDGEAQGGQGCGAGLPAFRSEASSLSRDLPEHENRVAREGCNDARAGQKTGGADGIHFSRTGSCARDNSCFGARTKKCQSAPQLGWIYGTEWIDEAPVLQRRQMPSRKCGRL